MLNEGMLASLIPFGMASCLLIFVVIRTMRRAGERKSKSPIRQVKDAKAFFDKSEPNKDFPLLDSNPAHRKWQAEMHDVERQVSAQIDTKLALLNATIRLADKKIQQLQQLQNSVGDSSKNNDDQCPAA